MSPEAAPGGTCAKRSPCTYNPKLASHVFFVFRTLIERQGCAKELMLRLAEATCGVAGVD